MRHSKATVAAGSVRTSGHGVRRTIIVAVVAVVALWTAYAFAQEAYIGHKLSQQVADLHSQNARLAAENKGYHKDVQSLTSGAANEEEARQNGFARHGEKVYLITDPPSPTPAAPVATPAP
ncbi:MAG TPA: septum formation initiator family protein [Candidatus Dormibacteraeota bacterium]|nr:septum formation initiator family protein [Candidatus Dormibacteraeota bacterium]